MPQTLQIGPLTIHPDQGLALAGDQVVVLSVRELHVLVALAEQAGGVVRREDLFRRVWGRALRAGDRSIDVYVHKLRVKLEQALPSYRCIHTHVGFGYRLSPERLSHAVHNEITAAPHPAPR